jgi:hypothetical protein
MNAKAGRPATYALNLGRSNCSAMSLSWQGDVDDTVLEYELRTHQVMAAADSRPSVISNIQSTYHTVTNLDSSTDYAFQVRARTASGWGTFSSEMVARTDAPPRVMQPPESPIREHVKDESGCGVIELRLPRLRRGCARETGLSLEYRLAGETEWRAYKHPQLIQDMELLRVDLKREGVRHVGASGAAEYRLRAQRGPLVSGPSEILPGLEKCKRQPPRFSTTKVAVFAAIFVVLLVSIFLLWRATSMHQGGRKSPKTKKMTPVGANDNDEDLDDELSVRYELIIGGEPVQGMLPLAGITTSAALLEELAEFGCELQNETILDEQHIEVYYEDRRGKTRPFGPNTPLQEALNAGEVTVVQTSAGHAKGPSRVAVTKPPTRVR